MAADPIRFRSMSENSMLWPTSGFMQADNEENKFEFKLDGLETAPEEEDATFEFKLVGMEALQDSLASLLMKPGQGPGFAICTEEAEASPTATPPSSVGTPPCLQEASPTSTPPSSVSPPPGLEALSPRPRCATSPVTCGSPGASSQTSGSDQPEAEKAAPSPVKGWRTLPRPVAARLRSATEGGAALESLPTTTVTLKNVPRKCSRAELAASLEAADFGGKFELVHVPVDLGKKSGTGQALVSFHGTEACEQFTKAFHQASPKALFAAPGGGKPLEVVAAPLQGLEANVAKLQASAVMLALLEGMPAWRPQQYDTEGQAVDFAEEAREEEA